MPLSLARMGGKRPDFAVSFGEGESLVYMDAKFHQTANLTEFVLEEAEIAKFRSFREWALTEAVDDGDRDVFLMLYPHELNGDRFIIIHLDDMAAGDVAVVGGKPARRVAIQADTGLWFDQDEGPAPAGPPPAA